VEGVGSKILFEVRMQLKLLPFSHFFGQTPFQIQFFFGPFYFAQSSSYCHFGLRRSKKDENGGHCTN
jgi:hypothetical protein